MSNFTSVIGATIQESLDLKGKAMTMDMLIKCFQENGIQLFAYRSAVYFGIEEGMSKSSLPCVIINRAKNEVLKTKMLDGIAISSSPTAPSVTATDKPALTALTTTATPETPSTPTGITANPSRTVTNNSTARTNTIPTIPFADKPIQSTFTTTPTTGTSAIPVVTYNLLKKRNRIIIPDWIERKKRVTENEKELSVRMYINSLLDDKSLYVTNILKGITEKQTIIECVNVIERRMRDIKIEDRNYTMLENIFSWCHHLLYQRLEKAEYRMADIYKIMGKDTNSVYYKKVLSRGEKVDLILSKFGSTGFLCIDLFAVYIFEDKHEGFQKRLEYFQDLKFDDLTADHDFFFKIVPKHIQSISVDNLL